MTKSLKLGSIIFVSLCWVTACSPKMAPTVTNDESVQILQELYPNADPQNLQHGYNLFTQNCGNCHKLHLPQSRTAAEWSKVLPPMTRKAKLTPQDAEAVTQYVMVEQKRLGGK
ncbi:MAG: cytochrome c [Chitinophagales bacterium]|nr:hypothetical protein [Bacteroidota bacterium]MCB9043581.1 hypothetical protein [Chitinophagales bacterium]